LYREKKNGGESGISFHAIEKFKLPLGKLHHLQIYFQPFGSVSGFDFSSVIGKTNTAKMGCNGRRKFNENRPVFSLRKSLSGTLGQGPFKKRASVLWLEQELKVRRKW
jgi:hypothetical protein